MSNMAIDKDRQYGALISFMWSGPCPDSNLKVACDRCDPSDGSGCDLTDRFHVSKESVLVFINIKKLSLLMIHVEY